MLEKGKSLTILAGSFVLLSTLAVVVLGVKTDPNLKSARTQLMKARAHLYAGENDADGHRARAMGFTTQAIDEVTASMKANHHAQTLQADEIFAATTSGPGSHMRKALTHLKQAQTNLASVTPDAGGHHAKATALIVKAIDEVEKANAKAA